MKNILPKIKINNLTYFLLFICLLTGMFKNILLIFLIVLVHELGHVFFINIFNYNINIIEIYPFGGITKVEKDLNAPINHDLIIALGGFFFQFLLCLVFNFLFHHNLVGESIYNLFNAYNKSILVFNLLPIIPLDGYVILKSMLEKTFTFKTSHYMAILVSIFGIIGYFQFNYIYSLNNYMIITLLIYKTFESLKNYKYIYNRFLLERYMNTYPYKKTQQEKNKSLQTLKKETLHFFKVGNKYVHEKEILKELFDKNRHF